MSGEIGFKTIAECEEVMTAMAELQRTKGWQYFVAAMERAESLITQSLPNMPVAFDRDKALGELVQIRKGKQFAATMTNTALSTRERLKQKEKKNG